MHHPRYDRAMRSVPLLACVCALSLAAASRASGQLRGPSSPAAGSAVEQVGPERLVRLEQWLKAVARHDPGQSDDALLEVAAWPNAALKLLWIDANVLTQMIRSVNANRFTVRPEGQTSRHANPLFVNPDAPAAGARLRCGWSVGGTGVHGDGRRQRAGA